MLITSAESFAKRRSSDILILPFWQEKEAEPACPMREFETAYRLPVQTKDFLGKEGECAVVYRKGPKEDRILLLGLGKQDECQAENLRRAYSAAVKLCRKKKFTEVSAALPEADFPMAAVITEGMLLANYAFDQLKSDALKEAPSILQKICLVGIDEMTLSECKRTARLIEAVNFARDLVNGNADDVTPERLAAEALRLAKESSTVKTTIFNKKRIEKEKMGLLLAVNKGSSREPRFILVEYRGNPDSSDVTAIIGKGITYDTGGLNIKPTGSMETMKDDMSGAAAVLGTIKAAAALRLKVNILGAIASTENSVGPDSYKPGDVFKSYAGTTVEISNTDAEGRLVLADALAYVQDHYKPSRMIDLATLTGGIVVALGEEATGLFCNDDPLAHALVDAGSRTHERLWRMPIFAEYKEALKSNIADIKNSADRKASSINGAMFLLRFIKKVPWAHLDIAGTAFLSAPKHYHTTNATGVGVRLLVDFLMNHEKAV
jgi:leucyl aminopeptidase